MLVVGVVFTCCGLDTGVVTMVRGRAVGTSLAVGVAYGVVGLSTRWATEFAVTRGFPAVARWEAAALLERVESFGDGLWSCHGCGMQAEDQ